MDALAGKYGIIVCMSNAMKKTFNIDEDLFQQAKAACGASTDTETIRLGLQALVRHDAYQRLRALLGSEPHAQDVPRRREKLRSKSSTA
jgi:Arc/MetJ family transcription regulator